jgi:hypothetical protein
VAADRRMRERSSEGVLHGLPLAVLVGLGHVVVVQIALPIPNVGERLSV